MTAQEILANHLAKLRERQEKWENVVNVFPLFFEDLAKLGVEPSFSEVDGSLDIRFAGDSKLFQTVWSMVRSLGFKPSCRPSTEPRAEFCTFWYHPDPQFSRIWFHFASSVCKVVKVGTKMVEQDVYTVTCVDGQTTLGSLLASENDNALARE